jgi:hypothetical protein
MVTLTRAVSLPSLGRKPREPGNCNGSGWAAHTQPSRPSPASFFFRGSRAAPRAGNPAMTSGLIIRVSLFIVSEIKVL